MAKKRKTAKDYVNYRELFPAKSPALGATTAVVAGVLAPVGVEVDGCVLVAGGFGAETPAMSDPNPNFCKLGASSLPVASIPFAD